MTIVVFCLVLISLLVIIYSSLCNAWDIISKKKIYIYEYITYEIIADRNSFETLANISPLIGGRLKLVRLFFRSQCSRETRIRRTPVRVYGRAKV